MGIVLLVVSLLVQVAAHEAGHAMMLRRYGFAIEKIGLGFGPSTGFRWRGVQCRIAPVLLGAYVQPTENDMERIRTGSFRRLAVIMNMGAIVNLVIASACLSMVAFLGDHLLVGPGALVVTVLIVLGYEIVAAYVIPAIGPVLLGVLLYGMGKAIAHGAVTGLTGLSALVPADLTLISVLWMNFLIGAALFLNATPLGGLDGGHVWMRILHDRFGHGVAIRITVIGAGVLIAMIGYSIVRDLINIAF